MADIYVYGTIGSDWWDEDSKSASDFAKELEEANGEDVTIHVNSCGGNVFDAHAMSELLRSYKGRTTASIEGIAASAASFFALTADRVLMNPSALLMIHNPYALCQGEAEDMRKTADMLDKVRGTIVEQYVRKTGLNAEDVETMMDAETWMDAKQALEDGFVDELTDSAPVAAMLSKDVLAAYKRVPDVVSKAEDEAEDREAKHEEEPAGDTEANIKPDDKTGSVEVTDAAPVASPRTVCIDGMFYRL